MKPTNNDPQFRTYNREVKAMSAEDWTQHNPWRCEARLLCRLSAQPYNNELTALMFASLPSAPGAAPVYDTCGMAGGSPKWVATQLSYIDTPHAKQGDLGSKVLPYTPTGVVWRRGDVVEAKWGVRAK